jgi:hypothetical protein
MLAHPESFQLEKAGTRAFVNAPDRKEIEVVDLAKNATIAKVAGHIRPEELSDGARRSASSALNRLP